MWLQSSEGLTGTGRSAEMAFMWPCHTNLPKGCLSLRTWQLFPLRMIDRKASTSYDVCFDLALESHIIISAISCRLHRPALSSLGGGYTKVQIYQQVGITGGCWRLVIVHTTLAHLTAFTYAVLCTQFSPPLSAHHNVIQWEKKAHALALVKLGSISVKDWNLI